jgi:hypothetical protein
MAVLSNIAMEDIVEYPKPAESDASRNREKKANGLSFTLVAE